MDEFFLYFLARIGIIVLVITCVFWRYVERSKRWKE
jgi:hypothetical protein